MVSTQDDESPEPKQNASSTPMDIDQPSNETDENERRQAPPHQDDSPSGRSGDLGDSLN